MPDSAVQRRFAASLIAALLAFLAVAFAAGVGTAHAISPGARARILLNAADPQDLGVGPGGIENHSPTVEQYGLCWTPIDNGDGSMDCSYARQALVEVSHADSVRQAKKDVLKRIKQLGLTRKKASGKPITARGIGQNPSGGAILIATGRWVIYFELAAYSVPLHKYPALWANSDSVKLGANRIVDEIQGDPGAWG